MEHTGVALPMPACMVGACVSALLVIHPLVRSEGAAATAVMPPGVAKC